MLFYDPKGQSFEKCRIYVFTCLIILIINIESGPPDFDLGYSILELVVRGPTWIEFLAHTLIWVFLSTYFNVDNTNHFSWRSYTQISLDSLHTPAHLMTRGHSQTAMNTAKSKPISFRRKP